MNKFTLALLLCLGGCSFEGELKIERKETETTSKQFKIHSPPGWRKLEIIVIDDCEYLYGYVGGNGGYVLCHKGNCNNPIHVYNKENENDK